MILMIDLLGERLYPTEKRHLSTRSSVAQSPRQPQALFLLPISFIILIASTHEGRGDAMAANHLALLSSASPISPQSSGSKSSGSFSVFNPSSVSGFAASPSPFSSSSLLLRSVEVRVTLMSQLSVFTKKPEISASIRTSNFFAFDSWLPSSPFSVLTSAASSSCFFSDCVRLSRRLLVGFLEHITTRWTLLSPLRSKLLARSPTRATPVTSLSESSPSSKNLSEIAFKDLSTLSTVLRILLSSLPSGNMLLCLSITCLSAKVLFGAHIRPP